VLVEFRFQADDGLGGLLVLSAALGEPGFPLLTIITNITNGILTRESKLLRDL
jgi:hypothetical protein